MHQKQGLGGKTGGKGQLDRLARLQPAGRLGAQRPQHRAPGQPVQRPQARRVRLRGIDDQGHAPGSGGKAGKIDGLELDGYGMRHRNLGLPRPGFPALRGGFGKG